MHSSRGRLRIEASEDRWMVAPGCDEWLTTWCGLTLGWVLQVQVVAWFALVQVKSGRERSMPCGASEEWRDKYAWLEGPGGQQGQVRAAWWWEKQDEVVDWSRCRVEAHDQSLHVGFAAVHQKTVGLLGWATKPRPEARRAETGSGRAEKLRCRRTRGGIAWLASGGRGLWRRRGRAMKRSATWPICPWGVVSQLKC
jgi:hypothetical protein